MEKYYVISFNFIYGLLLDIIIVGIIKNLTKRERPGKNTVHGLDWGPDQYSFPSGHASRAVFIAFFLIDQFRIRSVRFSKLSTGRLIDRFFETRPNILTSRKTFKYLILVVFIVYLFVQTSFGSF